MRLVLDVTSFQKALMGSGSRHVFDETGGLIGRGRRSDWVLPDPDRFVSSTHAEITFDGERFYITDVSTNGVFLNDSSVPLGKGARWPMSDGDRMALGDFEIAVHVEEDGTGAQPKAPTATPLASAPAAPTPSTVDIDSLLGPDPGEEDALSGDAEPEAIPPFPDPQVLAPPPRVAPLRPPASPPASPPAPPLAHPTPDSLGPPPVQPPPSPAAPVPPPPPRFSPKPEPMTESRPMPAPPPVADEERSRQPLPQTPMGEERPPVAPAPPPVADAVPASPPPAFDPPEPEAGEPETAGDQASTTAADYAAAIADLDLDDLIGSGDRKLEGAEAPVAGPGPGPALGTLPPPPPSLTRRTPAAPPMAPPPAAVPPTADIAPELPDDIDDLLGGPLEPPPAPPSPPLVAPAPDAATAEPTPATEPLSPGGIEAGLVLPDGLSELERKARLWDEFTRVYNDLRGNQ